MRLRRPYLLALPLIPALACGGTEPGSADEVAVDTVGGVERVRYGAEPLRPLEWTADTLFVLGDAFAEDVYQFNDVTPAGLDRDGAGGLVVLDRQGGRVLRYGPDGSHRATYGGPGEGPGELSQPLGLDAGPGDTLWVSDFSNSRLTGYPLDGGEPRLVPFPEGAGFPDWRLAAVADGYVMQFRPLFSFGRGANGRMELSGAERPALPLVRYDSDLQPRDTLWTTPQPPTDMVQLEVGNRVMVTMMSREFYPDLRWAAFRDGGVVVSDTAAYLLRLVSPGGEVVRVIERAPAPRAVTEADREAARERIREESGREDGIRIGGGGGPDEATREKMLEQRLEKMTFADIAPRVVALQVDPEDRIWVGVTEESADQLERIDVYDRDGRLIGELRDFPMPDVFLDGGRIGLLRRDDLDVQQVVVMELVDVGDAAE